MSAARGGIEQQPAARSLSFGLSLFKLAMALCLVGIARAEPLPPAGQLAASDSGELRVSMDPWGIQLTWPTVGSDVAYSVEIRDSWSHPSQWRLAPASVFPLQATTWHDPILPNAGVRFYRISTAPLSAQRGRLLATASLGALSPAQIQAVYAQIGIPIPAQGGVQLYKLTYETVNPFGARTMASGLVVIPQSTARPLPLVSYQHGTLVGREEVPSSAAASLERVVGIAFGSGGYVAVLPDYLGLGDSPGLHPFVHAKSEATAGVDLLRATRVFCASNSVALNGQLFLIGYSQGGHATMALHRELETFHTNEFTVTASAPMAGPYDVSGVIVSDFFSGRQMPNPYYFVYLIAGYQSIYHLAPSLSALLASPYDRTLPPLLDGQHDGGAINRAMGSPVPSDVFNKEYLNAFRNDPNHPLRIALRENDVYDWTPRAPMRLYHCDGDQDVLFLNSLVAYDAFIRRGATQVQLVDPYPAATHGDCAPIALLAAKLLWFDTLVNR